MKLGAPGESLSVDAVIKALVVPASVPQIDEALIDISAASRHEHSTRIFSVLGDDIDHSVDGICSPNRTARAADDFDPLDILKHCVLDLPINPRVQWCVHGSAVDQHEYVSGEGTPESAHTDGPCIRVDPCDLNTGCQTEGLRYACGPGTPDILLGDDVDRCWSSAGFYGLFGRGCNLNLAEFFQGHLLEPSCGLLVLLRGVTPALDSYAYQQKEGNHNPNNCLPGNRLLGRERERKCFAVRAVSWYAGHKHPRFGECRGVGGLRATCNAIAP